jgi:signal transduction histidine kinase/CheY-like chemotaxis protein
MRTAPGLLAIAFLALACSGSDPCAARELASDSSGASAAAAAALRVGVPELGPPLAWRGRDNTPQGLLVEIWRLTEPELGTVEVVLCGAPRDCRADLEAQQVDLAGPMAPVGGATLVHSQPVLSMAVSAATRRGSGSDARVLRDARVGLLDVAGARAAGMSGDDCDIRDCLAVRRWGPSRIELLDASTLPNALEDGLEVVVGLRPLLDKAIGSDVPTLRTMTLWRRWQYLAGTASNRQRLREAAMAMRRLGAQALAELEGFTEAFGDAAEFSAIYEVPELSEEHKRFIDDHPTVFLGTSPLEPLTVVENGEVTGLAIDSLRYHLWRIGITPVFEVGPWEVVARAVRAGRLDGFAYALAPAELQGAYAVSEPIIRAPFVAAIAPTAPFVADVDDLRELRAVISADYAPLQPTVQSHLQGIEMRQVESPRAALDALQAGTADVWLEFLPVVRSAVANAGTSRAQTVRPIDTGLFDRMAMAVDRSRGLAPLVLLVNDSINSSGAALAAVQSHWLAAREPQVRGDEGRLLWLALTLLLAGGCIHLVRELIRERERLRRSDRALRRAQLLSGVGSLEIPPPYDRVLFNGDTPRLLDLPRQTAAQGWDEHLALFDEDDAAQLDAALEAAWRTGQAGAVSVGRDVAEPRRYMYEMSSPQQTDTHRASVLVTLRDVTEQDAQERRQRALEREIVELQQLDALGRLAAGIAHDFNNVLVVIITNAELGLRDTPPDHPSQTYLQQILQAGLRSRELVAQLLNSVRPPAQTRTELDVAQLVRAELELTREAIPGNVVLEMSLPPGPVLVSGDRVQLAQVVANLVRNALDAMQEQGGKLTVALSAIPAEDGEGARALLVVRDTGIGMDEETRQQIFEYFFSTRASGSGLGLAIVRNIVLSHGGAVEVLTAPGKGAEFQVRLPLLEATAAIEPAPRGHLLVLDDEREILAAVSSGLRASGYAVAALRSPRAALEAVADASRPLDAVLCDVTLPGVSPIELAATVKGHRPDLAVVLLADNDERDALRDSDNVDLVLDKRMNAEELDGALTQMLSSAD